MTRGDLEAIRNPMLALAAIVLGAAAAIYYTDHLVAEARSQLTRQEMQRREADMRLLKSGEEKSVIVKHLEAYQQLQRRGFVGDEQRINWLDGLRLTNQQADLFGVDYEIGAQKPYPYAADLNPGEIQLKESTMKLRFRLLHEEDLMRFLGILTQQGVGIYTVDQCTLNRVSLGGAIRYQPNLTAECELGWITATVGTPKDQKKP
jgi:primosomal replication protein N